MNQSNLSAQKTGPSHEEMVSQIQGTFVYKDLYFKLNTDSTLMFTLTYEFKNQTYKFTLRYLIISGGNPTLEFLRGNFIEVIKLCVAPLFSSNVSFTKFQFKCTNNDSIPRKVNVSGLRGTQEEQGSQDPLEMEIELNKAKTQILKLYGVPANILNYETLGNPYVKVLYNLSNFFQRECKMESLVLKIQGVHYLNKNQNKRDLILGIKPKRFVKEARETKVRKKPAINVFPFSN